jgi:uncharacterized RDD family membrane protein YckC
MPWQTMQEGEILGPYSDQEFERILPSLPPATKIHKDGWKEWKRLGEVPSTELPQPPPPPAQDDLRSEPAGFVRRAAALLLDYVLIAWLLGLAGLGHSLHSSSFTGQGAWASYVSFSSSDSGGFLMDHLGWHFAATLLYESFLISRFGWTLGKFVFSLEVRHQGRRLGWKRSFCRVLAKKLNVVIFMLGYLMAAWDKDHKALHDHICATRVFVR